MIDPAHKENTVCIIGAGPAGLSAAYALSKAAIHTTVLEADARYVGGISRTVQKNGYCVDIGGHRFFSKSQEIVDLWKEILSDDLLVRKRKSRIYYRGKFYPYPLSIFTTLRNLGIGESLLCILSYLKATCFPVRAPQTFEQWVSNRFGKRLFRIFFKTYTEKVWGMPCDQISADWAAQRISGLSLFNAIKNAVSSALGLKKGNIKTLIEEFLYPRKGPGMMWERAASHITGRGSEILHGARVSALTYDNAAQQWNICYNQDGTSHTLRASHVISTMPLGELIHAITDSPASIRDTASNLRYRDFLIVALILKDKEAFDDQWIYVHTDDVKVGRIQNFKSWSPEMVPDAGMTCYGMEYFCFDTDNLWNMPDAELVKLAKREIVTLKLARADAVVDGFVIRQPKAYPVYDHIYQQHLQALREWMEQHCPNLQVAGRNAMHKYNNQDHSMMTALLAARNIIAGDMRYDAWKVNQDAEYHESGSSSASGERLVPEKL